MIEQEKEYIWFLYGELNRIRYHDHIHLKLKERIRWDIIDAEDNLAELQRQYLDEQRQAETNKRQAKSKECREVGCKICNRWMKEYEKKEKQKQEEEQKKKQEGHEKQQEEILEKENEDVYHSGILNSCDVSIKVHEAPKVEPTTVCEPLEIIYDCDVFTEIPEVTNVEPMKILEPLKVEPVEILEAPKIELEIVYEQQTEKASKVAVDLFVAKEKPVQEVGPIKVDNIEFIIPVNLLQPLENAKATLSSILFPKFVETSRMKTSSVLQNILSMKTNSWVILACYKTRGRVFSNKERNDGDQD